MMKKLNAKIVAITVASALATTGCGVNSLKSDDVRNYQKSKALTKSELVDYYAKALDYDSVVTRNIKVHKNTYETKEITGDKLDRLKKLTAKAQEILANDNYLALDDEGYDEASKIISPDTFYTLKTDIDNYKLTDGKILDVTGALGYYFVDTEFTATPRTVGQFNQRTSLLGINGVFIEDPVTHVFSIDVNLLEAIALKLNRYYYDNNIMKNATYKDGVFRVEEGVAPEVRATTADGTQYEGITTDDTTNLNEFDDSALQDGQQPANAEQAPAENAEDTAAAAPRRSSLDELTEANESGKDAEANEDANTTENVETADTEQVTEDENAEASLTEADANTATQVDNGNEAVVADENEVAIVSGARQIQFDVNEINSIIGSNNSFTIYPNLEDIYIAPPKEGDISGYGIYNAGDGGARIFGLSRDKLKAKIKIRFVFKDSLENTGEIVGTNAYIFEEKLIEGVKDASNITIPSIMMQQLSEVVDRSDRVLVNNDLASLMSGDLYTDMGIPVLRGFVNKHTGITKYMSKIRQVINKDNETNSYLLDVETTVTEGARDVDCYGTYKDRYYMVVQQDGTNFHITDLIRTSRELVDEPEINLDSSLEKSIVAMGLAGDVTDTNKKNITTLMSDLYLAGTDQILNATDIDGNVIEYTVPGSDEKKTYNRGLADCFDRDSELLSSDDRDYIIQNLINLVTKYGDTNSSTYNGVITEWIGGYDNQVEYTTEELIYYPSRGKGYLMRVYYLASNMNDVWMIDERKVLDEQEIEGELLQSALDRIAPSSSEK